MALFICQGCGGEHTAWDGRCPACGTTATIRLAATTDRMIERVVKGKYKIIRKLGQGGMGAVYLAEQVGIGQKVALKFLRAEFSSDAEIARRFLNEAKSYALVAHPNAVTFHDFGQDDEGNLFIAMEYCEGVDLKRAIADQGRLPLAEGIEIALQVADVLALAHGKGIIHRDLKPENIMIRRGLRGVHAKVLDFGIARLMNIGTHLTQAGAIAGTPRYMSPEQVEGRPVDLRADIYSLGIVLYEEITGRQPFDGNTISEILRKQAVEPMPHLTEAAADLDYPELDAVIQRACAKARDERWADMVAFAHALSTATPTQAHARTSPLQRSSRLATPAPFNSRDAAAAGTEAAAMERTMMRSEASSLSAQGTQLEKGGPPGTPQVVPASPVSDTSLLPAPSRARGPMVAVAGSLVLLVAGLAWLISKDNSSTDGAPVAPAVSPEASPVPSPVGTVGTVGTQGPKPDLPPAAPSTDALGEVVRSTMQDQYAVQNVSSGKTEFEKGNLEAAEPYLLKVPSETGSFAEANRLLSQIRLIREKLARARELEKSDLVQAKVLYQEVVRLNPKVEGALEGIKRCKAATVGTQME